MSSQDDRLAEHFFSFIAGSGGEFGPQAANELRQMFRRAQLRGEAGSFGGYVARLMIAEAVANGWRLRPARAERPSESEAS